jgi:hypothetical protein
MKDEMKIVKCACGLPMRQKDWAMHWRSCPKGISVPVTTEDIQALEFHEARKLERDEEHRQWLAKRSISSYSEGMGV